MSSLCVFHIPHIQTAITDRLTFQDLLYCIRVNKTWYHALLPVVWQDLVTFTDSDTPSICKDGPCYYNYFNTLEARQNLRRHCHLIQSLTTRNNNVLRVLQLSECRFLTEIHYRVDKEFSGDLGLDALGALLNINPYLVALTITHAQVDYQDEVEELKMAVWRVVDHPNLKSVGIAASGLISCLDEMEMTMMLLQSVKNVSMDIRSDEYAIARARQRAPFPPHVRTGQQRQDFRAQEKADQEIKETEGILQLIDQAGPELAVRNLDLRMLLRGHVKPRYVIEILKRCRALESLTVPWLLSPPESALEEICTTLRVHCTELRHLATAMDNEDNAWARLIDSCTGLRSFTIIPSYHWPIARNHQSTIPALLRHRNTLQRISLAGFFPASTLSLLESCPNLQEFSMRDTYWPVNQLEFLSESPPWVCKNLHTLSLAITDGVTTPDVTGQNNVLARQLYHRIGHSLSNLQHLKIFREHGYFNDPFNTTASSCLDLTLANGTLSLLSGLTRLETLTIKGSNEIFQEVADTEWVARHWPSIQSIEVPIPRSQLSNPLPELQKRVPHLYIVMGPQDGCRMCGAAFCEFGGDSNGGDGPDRYGAAEEGILGHDDIYYTRRRKEGH